MEKKPIKPKKSISKNKIHLKVEACVHVHFDIFKSFKEFLNTESFEYIQMYMLVVFTHTIATINRIYAGLENPLFSISTEFVDLFIYTRNVPELNQFYQNKSYIEIVNNYYKLTNQNKTINCDHTFFMHGYTMGPTLGVAYVNKV